MNRQLFRTIWISDLHLGPQGCQSEFLLDFLNRSRCEKLYLVGDIVDGWSLKSGWRHWTDSQTQLIREILCQSGKGTEVLVIPGNHDEVLGLFKGMALAGIEVIEEALHTTADGRKFLVTHGDQFERKIPRTPLISLGWRAYDAGLIMNHWINRARRSLGYSYWPILGQIKRKIGKAQRFMAEYERLVTDEVKRRGLDGVICGHIHFPGMRKKDGVLYCNDGDWVESCTALVEHGDGSLQLMRCAGSQEILEFRPAVNGHGNHGGNGANQY